MELKAIRWLVSFAWEGLVINNCCQSYMLRVHDIALQIKRLFQVCCATVAKAKVEWCSELIPWEAAQPYRYQSSPFMVPQIKEYSWQLILSFSVLGILCVKEILSVLGLLVLSVDFIIILFLEYSQFGLLGKWICI